MPRTARDTLILPVATVITSLWGVSGFLALHTNQTEVFLIVSGPFGGLCGFLFYKWAGNGNGGGANGKTPDGEP